jgi:uncharacterized protein
LPVLFEDSNGTCRGNDWARGFMRGVEMRRGSWADLITNDEHGGAMIPVLMLYHEHDENPELRPGQIAPERREEIIVQMAAGLVKHTVTSGNAASLVRVFTQLDRAALLPECEEMIIARVGPGRSTNVAAAAQPYIEDVILR